MEKYCKFCGETLPEGVESSVQHHQFKKMCINCAYAQKVGAENEEYLCTNETNKEMVVKKMIEAANSVTEAYKVDTFDIQPLPLKKITGKCKQWVLSDEVKEDLINLFN
jgi:hypothetical protein